MQLSWTNFKTVIIARSLPVQWVVVGENYWLKAIDGAFYVECFIPTDSTQTDTLDFETHHKASGNTSPTQSTLIQSTPSFTAKTLVVGGITKRLYARTTGFQQALVVGANTINYTGTYPWVKIVGVEVVNCEALDTVEMKVYDSATGAFSGVPNLLLNQFGYTVNMPKDFYARVANFDADFYAGMVIVFTYNSASAKTVGINLIINEVK